MRTHPPHLTAWCVALLTLAFNSPTTFGSEIAFGLPVDCELGVSCFIQNYYDHQVGPSFNDYRCGHLSYNGHYGTDFRVVNEAAMRQGVKVLAAAPGRVIGVRDGEPDVPVSVRGKQAVAAKEAGNGVVIDHGQGWQTQYSHLRQGSVRVKNGDLVKEGDEIGLIGQSGNADFPHVDFSVRQDGVAIDPFWPNKDWLCQATVKPKGLWRDTIAPSLRYQPTAILQVGFAQSMPTRLDAQKGNWSSKSLAANAPQLLLWAEIMGANRGDEWRVRISLPNDTSLVDANGKVDGDKAILIVAAGKKRTTNGWATGVYQGEFSLVRNGRVIASKKAALQVAERP